MRDPNRMTAREAAHYYLALGWNPVPSLATEKRPAICFSEYWQKRIPDWVLDSWSAQNIQLMCGRRWGLVVVDLDGPDAVETWSTLCLHRETPQTWIVRTGSGGWHVWYRTSRTVEELLRRTIWESDEKHSKIELLADKSLVIAPPSKHVRTGIPYLFTHGPAQQFRPALLPDWIAELPGVKPPPIEWVPSPVAPALDPKEVPEGHYDRKAVLGAIPDKLSLAMSWGLRIVGHANGGGWFRCHAVDREDAKPSAGFNAESGYYVEPGYPRRLSIFDIGVALGRYRSWLDAVNHLGSMYAVK